MTSVNIRWGQTRESCALPPAFACARLQRNHKRRVRATAAVVDEEAQSWAHLQMPRLEEEGRYFSEDMRVRAHEVGDNRECNIITVSNMLQASVALADEVSRLQMCLPLSLTCVYTVQTYLEIRLATCSCIGSLEPTRANVESVRICRSVQATTSCR